MKDDYDKLEIFLQFSRSEFGDHAHVVPRDSQQYQRTDIVTGKVSTARFPWDAPNVQKGLAELRSEEPRASALAALGSELELFLRTCRIDSVQIEEAAGKRPIRMTVRSAAAELYALPWELCRLEDSGKTLAQLPNCTIRYTWPTDASRTIAHRAEPRAEGGRILFAWSHGDEDDVPWNSNLKEIEAACAAMGGEEKWQRSFFDRDVDMIPHATFKAIYEKIEEAAKEGRPYSIVHVLCHGGKLDGDDGFGLVLTEESDRKRGFADGGKKIEDTNDLEKSTVAPDRLATLFDGAASAKPRLVVLCVCLGADSEQPGGHLGSVALAVHRTGIESVIASRFLLSKAGSVILTREFYHSLLAGPTSVEMSVEAARDKLRSEQTKLPDYAAIQLFQHVMGWDTRPVIFRPYRGLRHYQESDAALFFGRSDEIAEARRDIEDLIVSEKPRWLFVMGASGTGKSSLVGAGIVPALQKAQRTKEAKPWHVVRTRARAGIEAINNALQDRGDKPLLLIIDQFEEIFTDISDKEARKAFVQKIWSLVTDKESVVTAIATLRIDYLARCGEVVLPDGNYLDKLATAEEQRIFLHRMSADQLRAVIEGPAEWAGLEFAEGVVDRLVKDAGEEPGALPLLQIALEKIWENRSRGPNGRDVLHLQGYENLAQELITKADGIIAGFVDDIYKRAAKRLLVQLVDQRSDASPYTRRRVPKDEVRKGPAKESAVFDNVLEALTEACLVVVSEDKRAGQMIVEIAHEQIVRSWKALDTWLLADKKRLAEMARFVGWLEEENEAKTRGQSYLLQGGSLALASRLRDEYKAELRPEELDLVERSEREADRIVEENRNRQAALRDSLLVVGAQGLLAKNEAVWASKLLLEVKSPAKTRGWFQAAVETRRKIHLWSSLAGESIADVQANMYRIHKWRGIERRDVDYREARAMEREQMVEEIEEGRFVLAQSDETFVLWEREDAGGESQQPRGPYYENGSLWLIRPEEKDSKKIASRVRLLDRSRCGRYLLVAVTTPKDKIEITRAALWRRDEPETLIPIANGRDFVQAGGFSDDAMSIWIASNQIENGFLIEDFHSYLLGTDHCVQLGHLVDSEEAARIVLGDRAWDGLHLMVIVTNKEASALDTTKIANEGYVWRITPWSDLLYLGRGEAASFTEDGAKVIIVDNGSPYTISLKRLGATPEGEEEFAFLRGFKGNRVAEARSLNGRCSIAVLQELIPNADCYNFVRRLQVRSADTEEMPFEIRGPVEELEKTASPPVIDAPKLFFGPDGHRVLMVQQGHVWLWPAITVAAMVEELRRANRDCLPPDKRCEFLGETKEEAMARYEEEMRQRPPLDAAFTP